MFNKEPLQDLAKEILTLRSEMAMLKKKVHELEQKVDEQRAHSLKEWYEVVKKRR